MIADEATLARLMAAAQQGDKAAYRVLLKEVGTWLERYFRRRVPASDLEDLVQEVLMSVHRKRATWEPGRAFLPWLAAIARYRWVDHLRRAYRHATDPLDEERIGEARETDVLEAQVSLERLLAQLSQKQAQAIALVKIEGLSVAEAARRAGQSESLIKVNVHRGMKKLSLLVEKAD
jgi:RNA polymerase sigma-70 factor (ECF subfamily)